MTVAGDGRVFLAGTQRSGNSERAIVQVLGPDGSPHALYDLSGEFEFVTALSVEGDTMYAGGVRWVSRACAERDRSGVYRMRVAKYRLSGGVPQLVAIFDPQPQDVAEDTDPYCFYGYSSVAALRLVEGKLYVAFSAGGYAWYWEPDGKWYIAAGYPGLARLDGETLAKDWLYPPHRLGNPPDQRSWDKMGGTGFVPLLVFEFWGRSGFPVQCCWL